MHPASPALAVGEHIVRDGLQADLRSATKSLLGYGPRTKSDMLFRV